jgi:Protein of unknown function (DUF1552)
MAKVNKISRRTLLKGVTLSHLPVWVGLPPLEILFNSRGSAYAAETRAGKTEQPIESRFVFWFNGNGIVEKYWIPEQTGADYTITPCLAPLAPFKQDMHIITGLDNPAARLPGPGNDHHRSMSALVSGTQFTGRGAGGASLDQLLAAQIGGESRFRSLEIGVSQESFGESIQRNMSWAGRDRALPPEMIPSKLFDRLFGRMEEGWINRKRSILDTVREDAAEMRKSLGKDDQTRVEEHVSSIRDLERSIATLPPQYHRIDPPDFDGDMKDWPRIAKLQSDLLAYAFITRQTRVASYMLTKCQGLTRFPWLGYTAARHHDYTHADGKAPGATNATGQRVMRDICRWHVEEFAYLMSRLKSIPEGDGTLLDHCCLVYVHEHAEANEHKNNGLSVILAGHAGKLKTGVHTRTTGTVADLYLTVANDVMGTGLKGFPTAARTFHDIIV